MSQQPVINTLWAETLVDALIASGLQAVVISPGSRSTPMTLEFARRERDLRVYSLLDERSAGFFALGQALATGAPVALLCTSGTAAANYYPAVIEAHQSEVPLVVLTADRPHELRNSGANQTIDQVGLYGRYTRLAIDLPLPEAEPAPVMTRYLRAAAARALAAATGVQPGPVQLNLPFRKPLEPRYVERDTAAVDATPMMSSGVVAPAPAQLDALTELIAGESRGLIICGPRCPGGDFAEAVFDLAERSGYPLLADPLSGLRYHPRADAIALGGYESFLTSGVPRPGMARLVLQFGHLPVSASLNSYLAALDGARRIQISGSGRWSDDLYTTTDALHADPAQLARGLAVRVEAREDQAWLRAWQQAETRTRAAMGEVFDSGQMLEAATASTVLELLPPGAALFAGNSLPIRHLDQFGLPSRKPLALFGNRGASGIDGNTSTALGVAAVRPAVPTVLLSGDVTFYHDLNGLLAVKRAGVPLIAVVLNNNGGGIFRRLPVRAFEPPFESQFITPHDLDFSHAAALFGLRHTRVDTVAGLRSAFIDALAGWPRVSTVIEMMTDSAKEEAQRQAFLAQLK